MVQVLLSWINGYHMLLFHNTLDTFEFYLIRNSLVSEYDLLFFIFQYNWIKSVMVGTKQLLQAVIAYFQEVIMG